MNHCKYCQHWTAPRMVEYGPHGACNGIEMGYMGTNALAEIHGYEEAELKTMPDFGCVLYTAK